MPTVARRPSVFQTERRRVLSPRRGPVNGASIQNGLEEPVVEIVGMWIDGARALAVVAELGAHLLIQEVSPGDEFGEDAEAPWIARLKFGDELRRRTSRGRSQERFQPVGQVGADGEDLVQAL